MHLSLEDRWHGARLHLLTMSILNPEGRRQYRRRLLQREADEDWAALCRDQRPGHVAACVAGRTARESVNA